MLPKFQFVAISHNYNDEHQRSGLPWQSDGCFILRRPIKEVQRLRLRRHPPSQLGLLGAKRELRAYFWWEIKKRCENNVEAKKKPGRQSASLPFPPSPI